MSDTVAAIEASVSEQISTSEAISSSVAGQIDDLATALLSISNTMYIPSGTALDALSYIAEAESRAKELGIPDLPTDIDALPVADTSVTYLAADYADKIDVSLLQAEREKFIAAALNGIKPSDVAVQFVYQDPLSVDGDGGSAVILLVDDMILRGMAGYLVLTDDWAQDSFDTGKARDAIELEKASVQVQNKWSALGYDSAPGMLGSDIQTAHQTYIDNKTKQSRELGIRQYDTSIAFRQAMLSAAVTVAGDAINHANNVQNRALDAAKSVVRLSIDLYNLLVARWQNRVEIAKLPVDVAVENLKLDVDKAEVEAHGETDEYRLRLLKFEQESQNYRVILQTYRDTLRKFSQDLGLAEINDRIQMANEGSALHEKIMKAHVSLELAKESIQAMAETMSSEMTAVGAGGRFYGSAIASSNNAVATLVTLGNSGEFSATSDT